MPFQDFAYPQVLTDLGLDLTEADFTSAAPPLPPRPEFAADIAEDARLALNVNTEKARSEFIIAPVLLEVRRLTGRRFGPFTGILVSLLQNG